MEQDPEARRQPTVIMSDEKSIDMQAIDALRELSPDTGAEFVRELIEIYLQDTPQRIAELDEALAKGDVPTFTRAAHTLKGSSSNFGATKLTSSRTNSKCRGNRAT